MEYEESPSPKRYPALLSDEDVDADDEDCCIATAQDSPLTADRLALREPEPVDSEETIPIGSQYTVRPPSPPLASSQCTAAHANYAYASTFGEIFGMEGLESSSMPSLSPDESSTGSGSESDECHWLAATNTLNSRSLPPPSPSSSRTIVAHPGSLSAATAESSLGLAAMELSEQCRREAEAQAEVQTRSQTIGRSPSPSAERPASSLQSTVHELSPPPAEEQPLRKIPRYGKCATGKFSTDEVFDACDALGGF